MRAYCRSCDRAVEAHGDWPGACTTCGVPIEEAPVVDVVGPGLRVLFCGINPGVQTARAGHHFANPQNAFWRALHEAGFTPRRFGPEEERALLPLGIGITNAVPRATPGSADVRGDDVARGRARLKGLVREMQPAWVAFVGKQAAQYALGPKRRAHGVQRDRLEGARLFVLPSTSPANAAVPWPEKLRWFQALGRRAGAGRTEG